MTRSCLGSSIKLLYGDRVQRLSFSSSSSQSSVGKREQILVSTDTYWLIKLDAFLEIEGSS